MLFIILIGFTYGVVMANLWLPDKMSEIVNNGIIKQDMSAIWNNGLMMILVTAAGGFAQLSWVFWRRELLREWRKNCD